jgi:hypothetical protein
MEIILHHVDQFLVKLFPNFAVHLFWTLFFWISRECNPQIACWMMVMDWILLTRSHWRHNCTRTVNHYSICYRLRIDDHVSPWKFKRAELHVQEVLADPP